MSCKCQSCHRQFKLDLIIADALWELIKPYGKAPGAGLLCGACIMNRIEDLVGYAVYKLKE